MFDTIIHADWSTSDKKRWKSIAARKSGGWLLTEAQHVGPTDVFVDEITELGRRSRLLVGFDFPIGLAAAYGRTTGFPDFRTALSHFGSGEWLNFFQVAEHAAEISRHRPFYPRVSRKGVSPTDIVNALGVTEFAELRRRCERRSVVGREACVLFWTLGGNQVGKAALAGWREVIRPALLRGARLWPFDGLLDELSRQQGVVLAETYPALAYRLYDGAFLAGESKGSQAHRRDKAGSMKRWADEHCVTLSPGLLAQIEDGFGAKRSGEDAFDSFAGLVKMIEVVEGRHPEMSSSDAEIAWEGWILGR